jgi:hypothetical protein
MLLVKSDEVWNWDAHLVRTPNQISLFDVVISLDSLGFLEELDGLFYRVRDHSKVFFIFVVAESLFLHFNVVHQIDFSCCESNLFNQKGYDKSLDCFLLLIVDTHTHIGAIFNV